MFSLSFFFRSPSLILKSTAIKLSITDQAVSSFYVHHCSMVWRPHQSMVCHRSTSLFGILIALSPHRSCNHRSRHADLEFVGLCQWMWMWVGAGGGFGMWVCANLSGCFFFFFFWRWHWWMWVCVDGGCWCCCGNGGCVVGVVVVDNDDEDDRE